MDEEKIHELVKQYKEFKKVVEQMEKKMAECRKGIFTIVDEYGYVDKSTGSMYYDLEDSKVKKEKRAGIKILEDKMLDLLHRKNLKGCIKVKETIDEPAVEEAVLNGDISDAEFLSAVKRTESYALKFEEYKNDL